MRKLLLVLCALVLLILLAEISFAQETKSGEVLCEPAINAEKMGYETSPVNKLGRGLANIVTCWVEIPAQIFKVSRERNTFIGSTLGFVEGLSTSVLRAMTGVFDTATFVFPPYDKPLMEPEYAMDNAAKQYKEYFEDRR